MLEVFCDGRTVTGREIGRVLQEGGWVLWKIYGRPYSVCWHDRRPGEFILGDEQKYSCMDLLVKLKPCFDDNVERLCFLKKLWDSVN